MTEGADVAAIVLAGGRGSRLGGMSKADLVVGGRRLLDGVLDALRECAPCVVVGPLDTTVSAGVLLTREDPPFSGPAAAVAAGWSVLASFDPQPGWVVLLSCDLPGAADVVGPLIAAASGARGDVDAISAERGAPDGGHREWLVSIVRTRALAGAIDRLGGAGGCVDASMRRLLGGLVWDTVPVPVGAADDIDTWEDHATWTHRSTPHE